ncbi:hypothetical protein B7494_g8554 [Chlorociboria aeruginascens]|nr:hypothetical protein B7494_g8554 [Chlorociboria aeruginascens]
MSAPRPPPKAILQPLADFKPCSASRSWVSIPNPNKIPLIATATSDKSVRVYSLVNFTLHSVLEGGHSRSVRSVAWKPAIKREGGNTLSLATGSFDATMGIWRRREGEEEGDGEAGTWIRDREEEEEEDVFHDFQGDRIAGSELEVEIGADGLPKVMPAPHRQVTTADSDADEDWEFAIVLEGHDSEVKHVAYSPSGQWLASCSRDKSIWIWEEIGEEGDDEFETVAVLQEHTADVKCVCWRKDDGNGEVLASASYDDTIRLWREESDGEWNSFAVLEGHEGTVWWLDWEPDVSMEKFSDGVKEDKRVTARLLSSSADSTVRVWSLAPSPPPNRPSYFNPSIPSTMRPAPSTETWACTAILPKVHELPVYCVSWSKKTGRVVSAGSDGKIAIYEEVIKGRTRVGGEIEREWVVVSLLQGAHGPYEINHVTWCTRFDSGKRGAGEEMVVTTGDDGAVRAWAIDEAVEETNAE